MFDSNLGIKATGASLSTNLFQQLRSDILQGILNSGDRLTEQEVCEKYDISRTPVREAFRQLELDGLIKTIPNRGAFILGISKEDIQDMYELRKGFESIAVKWAIERITKEELEELKEVYEFMEFYTYKKDPEKMIAINMKFHELIYTAAHNRMIFHTLSAYQFYTKQTKANRTYVEGNLNEVLKEHKKIFQAFVDKDPEAGSKAVIEHLDNAKIRAKLIQ